MPLPKSRLRLMRNVIEMYTNTLLYDDIDSVHVDKYAATLRDIKERYALCTAQAHTEKQKLNQLNLFNGKS